MDNFIHHIFKEKRSYMCCITDNSGKVFHQSFPILIGSLIDCSIRSGTNTINAKHFGSLIIDGEFKIIPNFITNNVNNLVVYRTKKNGKIANKTLLWHINEKEKSFLLKFTDNLVQLTNNDKNINKMEQEKFSQNWIKWLNFLTPFEYKAKAEEYIELFKLFHEKYPNIDDLSNKVLITAPMILRKVKDLTLDMKRLKSIYTTGNMFFVLSKRNIINDVKNTNMSIQKDFSNIFMSIDGQKQDKILDFISITKRATVNQQTINSDALLFPNDAKYFICPYSCKEMKDAGVTLCLAQYIVVSKFVPISKISNYLQLEHNDLNRYRVVVNGFITGYKINLELSDFIRIKQKLLYVTFSKYGDKYLYIQSIDNLILKYCSKYQIFVSPIELLLFPNIFDNYGHNHQFSNFNLHLPNNYKYSQPSKTTVAINNIKGSCNNLKDENSTIMLLSSIGYNAGILHNFSKRKNMNTEQMVTSSNDESKRKDNFDRVLSSSSSTKKPKLDLNFFIDEHHVNSISNFSKRKIDNMLSSSSSSSLTKKPKLDLNFFIDEHHVNSICDYTKFGVIGKVEQVPTAIMKHHTNPFIPISKENNFIRSTNNSFDPNFKETNSILDQIFLKTMKLISIKIDFNNACKNEIFTLSYENQNIVDSYYENLYKHNETYFKYLDLYLTEGTFENYQLKLYTAFSTNGATVEDGFVMDIDLAKNGPIKLISATLNTRIFKGYLPMNTKLIKKYKIFYQPINKKVNDIIVYGLLTSTTDLRITQNKRAVIDQYKIAENFHYFIFYPLEIIYNNYNITSIFNEENGNILIHFDYLVPMGVGWKICNSYGQKGIIAKVEDLSKYSGIDAYGNCIFNNIFFMYFN